jgi:ribonuclease P protein component
LLPKKQRLRQKREFDITYRVKQSVSNEYVILYVGKKKHDELKPTKAGFVVSKKIDKRSTKRNRIKRLFRETFKNILKNEDAEFVKTRYAVIFLARQACLGASYDQIYKAVVDCINRAGKKFGNSPF